MIKVLESRGLVVSFIESRQEIVVTSTNKSLNNFYACYFYINNEITKFNYQRSKSFSVSIDLYSTKTMALKYYIWDKNTDSRTSIYIDINNIIDTISYCLYFFDTSCDDDLLSEDIEAIISSEDNFERGRDFIENNLLRLNLFPKTLWYSWGNWEVSPFNDRSWQWSLNWFEFLKYLMAFHHKYNSTAALNEAKTALESWVTSYLYNISSDFEFVWHDHTVALRAEQVLLFVYYLKKYDRKWMKENRDFIFKMFELIHVLGKKLNEESFYSKHTNHGLEQVRVLLLLGNVLNVYEWVNTAKIRLESELLFSFTTEGVHKENSPGYHQFVFKIFLSIFEKYSSYNLNELQESFDIIAPKALEYITYILRPDNNLPIVGDTELRPISDSYRNYFFDTLKYKNFLYSISQGKKGVKPTKESIVYPKSGYAIFRNTWGKESDFKKTIQIIFKAGCLSRYHHQQDENNFVIFAYGEDWVIDSGLYNYIDRDQIRSYARRRQAHNIPVISNSTYNHDDFNHRINSWEIYNYSDDSDHPFVAARNTVLSTIEHDRSLYFNVKKEMITIVDSINMLDQLPRDVVFLLHIPIDKKIDIHNNIITISSNLTNMKLQITLSIEPDSITVNQGIVNGKVNSVVSHRRSKYTDSQVLKIRYIDKDYVSLDQVLNFLHSS